MSPPQAMSQADRQAGRPQMPDLASLIPPSSAITTDALVTAPTPHLETPPGESKASSSANPLFQAAAAAAAAADIRPEEDDLNDDERVKMASMTLQASGPGWALLPQRRAANLDLSHTDPIKGCSTATPTAVVGLDGTGRNCSAEDSSNGSSTTSIGSSSYVANSQGSRSSNGSKDVVLPTINSKRKVDDSDSDMEPLDHTQRPDEKIRCTNGLDANRRPRSSSLHALQVDTLSAPRSGRFADSSPASALRHVSEIPAEGAGLRGSDAHVPAGAVESSSGVDSLMNDGEGANGALATAPSGWKIGNASSFAPPAAKRLCIRHQRMADEGVTARLQRSIDSLPLADQTAVNTVWSLFSSSPHPRRALMLQGLLTMCCFSQLSLLSSELALAIRIDPFSLFPREVSLKVLRHLDAISLGRAAQVSRTWRSLADDDLLWRNMCEQHIERKCEKCGWGLPLLNEKRKKARQLAQPGSSRLSTSPAPSTSPAANGTVSASGSLKRSITAAANAAAQERHAKSTNASRSSSPSPTATVAATKTQQATTRPWKSVYCERLAIERNWRRGRYTTKILSGHTDGIMCLQYSESLAHPAFPVVITGSYDRTARIWNMETGEELRVLRGHTRGVRCLQFDEAKLITGSMDRTLKIWNWRTGDLIRTLEGHTEGIVCLHFNEDTLASGSADSNIKIWNFRSGECFTLRGHTDWVNAVQLWTGKRSRDAQAQATRTDWKSGKVEAAPADEDHAQNRDRKSNDGQPPSFLFSASDDGTIRLWDLEERECLMSYDGHVGQVQSIKLVMLDDEAVRKLAQSAGGGPGAEDADAMRRREIRMQRNEPQRTRATSTDDDHEDVGREGAEGEASTCGYNPPAVPGGRAANTGSAPAIPDHFAYVAAASTSSSPSMGRRRESVARPSTPRRRIDPALLHLQDRLCKAGLVAPLPLDAELSDLEGPLAYDYVSSSSDKGSHHRSAPRPVLISGSLDNTIRLWCVRTGRCIRTLFGHTEGIWSLSLDKLRIASASHDRCIKTWDTDSGACKQTLVGHRGAVTCVQLGDDKIVSGSDDGDCRIWSFAPRSESS